MSLSAKSVLLAGLCAFTVGCATQPRLNLPAPVAATTADVATGDGALAGTSRDARELRVAPTPTPPQTGPSMSGATPGKTMEPPLSGPPVSASLADMPLPAFANEVFGNLLHLNFQLDSSLTSKEDLVTLRLPSPQSPRDLYRVAVQLLREYGVTASWDGSLLSLTPSGDSQGKEPPLVISGRALPDVPISHRPIFQLVELQAVRSRDVTNWLKMAYDSPDLKINEDLNRNAIVLFGKPDLVQQAVAAVKVLDRPFMRGRYSTRLEPAFVSASELAQRLLDVLMAEGYGVGKDASSPVSNTLVLPVTTANVVLVFSADQDVLSHVIDWARSIDQPNENASGSSLFYYQVKNTKASDLANVLRGLASGQGAPAPAAAAAAPTGDRNVTNEGSGARSGGGSVTIGFGDGRLTIDAPRNAILFQGDATQWQRLLGVIRQMDKPARQVMIEVTIADVTLENGESFGVSWLAKDNHGKYNGRWASGEVPTSSNSSGQKGGLSYLLDVNGSNRAEIQALANDNRVTVISTPRLLVKSGEEASIDVGDEVPIITTQTTSSQQTGGTNNLLQSVEYRKTGTILSVRPTVYSDDRIDLDISQEVSNVSDSSTGAVNSPAIFNRSIRTSLTLRDGGSVLLGGLISENASNGNSGVPYLKDVPVLGNLFKQTNKSRKRTELVLIIVPYIIEADSEAQAITQAIGDRLELINLPAARAASAMPPLPDPGAPAPTTGTDAGSALKAEEALPKP